MRHLLTFLFVFSYLLRAQLQPVVQYCEVQAFVDVSFIDEIRGFIVSSDGKLYSTMNQGNNWTEVIIPGNKGILAVTAKPDGVVFVAGKQGMVMISTDAGSTWKDVSVASLTGANLTIVRRVSSNSVVVAGGNGVFARSDDNGAHWFHTFIGDMKINSLVFTSWLEGWALMNSGGLARTTDGGITWSRFSTAGLIDNLKGILKTGEKIVVIGDNGLYSYSYDGGATWKSFNTWEYADVVEAEQTGDNSLLIMDNAGTMFIFTLDEQSLQKTRVNTSSKPRKLFYGFWKSGSRIYAVTDGPNFYTSKNSGQIFTSSIVTFAGRNIFSLQATVDNQITIVANSPVVKGISNGYIARTTDGGATWKYFHDGGWAAAAHFFPGGKIFRVLESEIQYSNDNGASWTTQITATKGVMISSQAIDDQSGYYIVTDTLTKPGIRSFSEIYRRNWTSSTLVKRTTSGRYTDLNFINAQNGWVLADSNRFLTTTNSGGSWSESLVITPMITSYIRFGSSSGIFVSRGGKIGRTVSNAKTWTTVLENPELRFNSVSAFDSTRIAIACDSGFIYSSGDGGVNWTLLSTGLKVDFSRIKMTDSTSFIITSTTGGVYRGNLNSLGSNGGSITLYPVQAERLLGNYPNPFNPTTNIEFLSPIAGEVRLTVYDITGAPVHSETFTASTGKNTRHFDASGLNSGVYPYSIEVGGKRHFSKMILVK